MGAVQSTQKEIAENKSSSASPAEEITEEAYHDVRESQQNEELENLRKEQHDLLARLQVAEANAKEAETLKNQLAEAQKPNPELEKLRKQEVDLKARLQAAEAHAKEAETLKTQLAEAQKPNPEFEKLRKEHLDVITRLQVAEGYEKEAETLKTQLAEAQKPNPELERLRKEEIDLKARLQAAEAHAKEAESLKIEIEQIKNAPPPKPVIDPALKKRVAELEKEVTESNQLVQTLKNENKHYRDHEQQVSAEINAMNREELAKLHKENFDMKVRLQVAEGYEKEAESLRTQLSEAQKPNPELELLRKELLDLKARLQSSEKHAKEADILKSELEKLKNAPPPQPVIDPALQQRVTELEEKFSESNQLVQTLRNENKRLHDREQQISAELNDLNSKELAKLHKENFDLKVRLQVAEGHAKEAESLKAQLENIPPSIAADPVLEKRVTELEQQLISADKKCVISNQLIRALQDDNKRGDAKIMELQAVIKSLTRDL